MKTYLDFVYKIDKITLKKLYKKKLIKTEPLGICKTGYINNNILSFIKVNLRKEYLKFEKKMISSICNTIQHEYLHACIHQILSYMDNCSSWNINKEEKIVKRMQDLSNTSDKEYSNIKKIAKIVKFISH